MKKILLTATVQSHIAQFHKPLINMLKENGYEVHVAAKDNLAEKNGLTLDEPDKIFNIPFDRSPLSGKNIIAYKELKKILTENKYNIVHCNTPMGSVITRLVAKKHRKNGTKVFYTAHGFHFYKGAPLKNWLLYYPIEKWLSKYTDILITINKEDYQRARNNLKAKRVEYIPGVGLDIDKFKNTVIDKNKKREEIGVPQDAFIILSVGELNKNKNHEVIIKSMAMINNPNIHYIICGQGPLELYLKKLAAEFGIEKKVHLLGYRRDIAEICKASDIFAFPSLREGFGMAALEAMACGLPIVTSNIRGIVDYSINEETGYTSNPNDVNQFAYNISKIISNPVIREKMSINNVITVNRFALKRSMKYLNEFYETGG